MITYAAVLSSTTRYMWVLLDWRYFGQSWASTNSLWKDLHQQEKCSVLQEKVFISVNCGGCCTNIFLKHCHTCLWVQEILVVMHHCPFFYESRKNNASSLQTTWPLTLLFVPAEHAVVLDFRSIHCKLHIIKCKNPDIIHFINPAILIS